MAKRSNIKSKNNKIKILKKNTKKKSKRSKELKKGGSLSKYYERIPSPMTKSEDSESNKSIRLYNKSFKFNGTFYDKVERRLFTFRNLIDVYPQAFELAWHKENAYDNTDTDANTYTTYETHIQ